MTDTKNTYKVSQIFLWHLFWTFLAAQLQEATTCEPLLRFSIITPFWKWQLLLYRHRSTQAPICWVFKPHMSTWSPSKQNLKVLYQKLCQNSTITSLILMIWHWNSIGWRIWLRWTSTSKIGKFWECMSDLLSSKPNKKQLFIYSRNWK